MTLGTSSVSLCAAFTNRMETGGALILGFCPVGSKLELSEFNQEGQSLCCGAVCTQYKLKPAQEEPPGSGGPFLEV